MTGLSSVAQARGSVVSRCIGDYNHFIVENASQIEADAERLDNINDFEEIHTLGKLCETADDEELFDGQVQPLDEFCALVAEINLRILDFQEAQTPENHSEDLQQLLSMVQRHQPLTQLQNDEHPLYDIAARKLAMPATHFECLSKPQEWEVGSAAWRDDVMTGSRLLAS